MKNRPDWLWGLGMAMLITLGFSWRIYLQGRLPVPSDALVGLYHPFRDAVAKEYPAGIAYKNYLITDPVRQQIPWRLLAVESWRKGNVPGWNPYQFAGVPLLANPQAGVFSPFTLPFLILPFSWAWVFGIVAQTVLALWFSYLFLRGRKLSRPAALVGGLAFGFGGFAIAWLTWGTVLATALWLPLLLYLIGKRPNQKRLFLLAAVTALTIFSGHLQIAFYVLAVTLGISLFKKDYRALAAMAIGLLLSAIQLLPALDLILRSWRFSNPTEFLARPDWFLPFRHLIQMIAPDFFGNPATLNYWGEFNYGEFVSYVGIVPLLLSLLALKKGRRVWLPAALVVLSLLFALPTTIGKLPVRFGLPFLATLKPSRLIFLTTFGLAWLAAEGWDELAGGKPLKIKNLVLVGLTVGLSLGSLWTVVIVKPDLFPGLEANLIVARRNLILPSALFVSGLGMIGLVSLNPRRERLKQGLLALLVVVSLFDLFRFGWKFAPFSQKRWFFPMTETISQLQAQAGYRRFLTLDRRLLPPNVGAFYHLTSAEGYDPIFPADYGQLVAAWERDRPDNSFFEFNRIVRPQRLPHRIANLLGIRYFLSLTDLDLPGVVKIGQEGETRIYQNNQALPRAFLVSSVEVKAEPVEVLKRLWSPDLDLGQTALAAEPVEPLGQTTGSPGSAVITRYQPNQVIVQTKASGKRFLVLTDRYDPDWQVFIDGRKGKLVRANYAFRGVVIPSGEHRVEFVYRPRRFFQGLLLAGLGLGALVTLALSDRHD